MKKPKIATVREITVEYIEVTQKHLDKLDRFGRIKIGNETVNLLDNERFNIGDFIVFFDGGWEYWSKSLFNKLYNY